MKRGLCIFHLLFITHHLSFSQNIGIGNTNPTLAGLVVDTKVGADHAIFGSNTTGVAIESNWPGIGFNTNYNGSRKAIATGYGGLIFVDPGSGGMGLCVTDASYSAGAVVTMNNAMTIKPNGDVGIGTNPVSEKLEVAGNVQASAFRFSSPKVSYYNISPAAFKPTSNDDLVIAASSAAYYTTTNDYGFLIAPISLPQGAHITDLTVYFMDLSSTADLWINLIGIANDGSPSDMANLTSSGSPGNSSMSTTSIASSNIINQSRSYSVTATSWLGSGNAMWPGGALQIKNIVITYTTNFSQ